MPACLMGVLHVLAIILLMPANLRLKMALLVTSIPFAFSAFFLAGREYELHIFLDDLKTRDRNRLVTKTLAELGIKEQERDPS